MARFFDYEPIPGQAGVLHADRGDGRVNDRADGRASDRADDRADGRASDRANGDPYLGGTHRYKNCHKAGNLRHCCRVPRRLDPQHGLSLIHI